VAVDDVTRLLELPPVSQIGMVVEDAQRTIDFFQTMGIGPFRVVDVEPRNIWDRGEEKPLKFRLAFAQSGQVQIELIQVVEGDSFHLESLRERGDNVHHLGFRVKDYDAKLAQARAMGFEVLQTGPGGRLYAYLDTQRFCGTIIELIEERN